MAGENVPFDAVVIGTGFGGAVASCRLAQANKRVCILERGRRYLLNDFPRPAKRPDNLPQTSRWLWTLDQGLWDLRDLQGMLAAVAAGYGGGSLVYANVHLRAPAQVFAPLSSSNGDPLGWPTAYTRVALDPYYDAVAAALRVRPIPVTLSPPSPRSETLPRVDAMREVARRLARSDWLFLPPLAIDFSKCVMCAECIAGCQFHAKNTLDLNYLAEAEKSPNVEVRTLAEVVSLTEDANQSYTVTYRDHVTGGRMVHVHAKSVFLCAGAVGTTELLLRCRNQLPIHPDSKKQIGRRFFGNGDAIAMVYDTTIGPAPVPTVGPTIATTLLYAERPQGRRAAPGEWFVLQDGAYPKWLEPLLGLFRGKFWLGRNRIERPQARMMTFDMNAAIAATERVMILREVVLGLFDARGAFLRPTFQTRSLVAGLSFSDILPPQIGKQLVPDLQTFIKDLEARNADPVSSRTLDEVGRRVKDSSWFNGLFVERAKDIARPFLLGSTLEIVHRFFLNAPAGTTDPYSFAILWPLVVGFAEQLFLGEKPNDNALLMLAVGVDAAPGRLDLDGADQLRAYWNLAANIPFSSMEERLIHDVSEALGGELRLNPDSTARQRPVTVHCLGGCAMSDVEANGVTNPNGKVWGTKALYVLDGAAIPSSLGVNPSATIAAVAERNVRMALEESGSLGPVTTIPIDRMVPGWPPEKTVAQIQQELGQTGPVLDPVSTTPQAASPRPKSPAVGFKFNEVMQGFYRRGDLVNLPIRADFNAVIDDLNAFLVNPLRPVEITGKVWLTRDASASSVEYQATGTLNLLKRIDTLDAVEGLLTEWQSRPTQRSREERERDIDVLLQELQQHGSRYEMDYNLTLDGPDGPLTFAGVKKIYGGLITAAWVQTTTLEVTISDDAWTGTGKMHVHLADFLTRQLPSFTVTGTSDDVRIAWAFGRFFRFFFGALRQVYLPRVETLDPFGDRTR